MITPALLQLEFGLVALNKDEPCPTCGRYARASFKSRLMRATFFVCWHCAMDAYFKARKG